MPLYNSIFFADGSTPMSIEAITSNQATSIWESIKNFPLPVADAIARDLLFPVGTVAQGDAVWRLDYSLEERYFETYVSGTNEGGATPAGWYAVSGQLPQYIGGKTATQALATTGTVLTFPQVLETNDLITYASNFFTVANAGRYEVLFQADILCSATQSDLLLEVISTVDAVATTVASMTKSFSASKTENVSPRWYIDVLAGTMLSFKGTATGVAVTVQANSGSLVKTYASIRYIAPSR